ncbi:MAG: NAD(P)H-hydrate epimerase [Ahniella sp.]|nr:NAD(P)H-hydrate epimerase [Ahniella sp.]
MLRPIHMLCSEVEIRAFERSEAVRLGCSLFDLMQRAAASAFRCLRVTWPEARHITIVCGPGNNGGDGFALASLLRNAGLQPRVLAITAESRAEEAIRARALWRDSGGSIELCSEAIDLARTDLIVDALFGIGLTRAPDGLAATVIQAIHRAGKPLLSIDLPSGVHTDSGACPGVAVRANLTLAMIAGKRGLFTGDGKARAGRVMCDDLGLAEPDCSAHLLGKADLEPWFKRRPTLAHKGTFGRALLIAGAPGMAGAALLAAGAASCGARLCSTVQYARSGGRIAGTPSRSDGFE